MVNNYMIDCALAEKLYNANNINDIEWLNKRMGEITYIVKCRELFGVYDSIELRSNEQVKFGNIIGYFVVGVGGEKYFFHKEDKAAMRYLESIGYSKSSINKSKKNNYDDFANRFRGTLMLDNNVVGIYNIDVKKVLHIIKDKVILNMSVDSFGKIVYNGKIDFNGKKHCIGLIVSHDC